MTAALAGLALGLSLIIAIGAQNLFVLRQGIRREHVLLVAAVCAVSDILLIALGVSGVGLVLETVPWLIVVVRWAGAAFLVGYGLLAARRAWRPTGQALEVRETDAGARATATADGRPAIGVTTRRSAAGPTRSEAPLDAPAASGVTVGTVVLTCLALTWLNPHVYLDTVFLLGGVASTHGEDRWWFAAGAALGSVLWFTALAVGARYLARWLRTPKAWRILDAVIAVVMIGLGISLVLPLG